MESNEKSPIIERLCKFIEISGLTASQFADRAGIPRPSLSQMLNGRNKSVNNHVLSKLNDAFPELNIVWLLFGRGDMCTDSNLKISEPQISLFNDSPTSYNSEIQQHTDADVDSAIHHENTQTVNSSANLHFFNDNIDNSTSQYPKNFAITESERPIVNGENTNPEISKIVNSKINERSNIKKIASIIVLYTDNSFETFMPSNDV